MRLVVCADVHVGNFSRFAGEYINGLNARCRATLATLTSAVARANDRGATLVIAGDLFHVKRPEPAVIAAVQLALNAANTRPIILLGNHDAIGPGDSALAPLWAEANLCAPAPVLQGGVLLIPWSPVPAKARLQEAVGMLKGLGKSAHIVIMHCGLYDDSPRFPEYLRGPGAIKVADVRDLLTPFGTRLVLAGDYHRHWPSLNPEMTVMQIGALCPTGFSDEGICGAADVFAAIPVNVRDYGVAVDVSVQDSYDVQASLLELPGPRFLSIHEPSNRALEVLSTLQKLGHGPVYVRLCHPPGAEAEAESFAESLKDLCAGVALEPAAAALHTQAALPTQDDIHAALHDYVQSLGLPAHVSGEVLARATGYVKP